MPTRTWLVKSEPSTYSFDDLVRDKETVWDGIRNFEARNNLRAMKAGDQVLFYHTGSVKAVVAIAKVSAEAFPETTSDKGEWSAIKLKPVRALKTPVPLSDIKSTPAFKGIQLLTHSRLSVMPIPDAAAKALLALGA